MSEKRNPLKTVRRLESLSEFDKSKKVAAAMRHLEDAEQRLATLREYYRDYARGGPAQAAGVSASLVRGRADFLSTLAAAVEDQTERVDQLRGRVDREIRDWRKSKARLNAVDRFLDRELEERRRHQQRREQAQLDEAAGQR